jgi:serine/threonine protein kinase
MSASLLHERYQMQTPLHANKPNVRKAWDRQERQSVIVKSFLDPHQAQLEFTALHRLVGVGAAVQMLDTYSAECIGRTEWCIILECAEKGTLLDMLERLPTRYLPEQWLRAVARQLVVGLFELHARGVVHGDIKPSNILQRADGSLAYCDFGLSTVSGLATGASPNLVDKCSGTPAFVAPEIITIAMCDAPVSASPATAPPRQYDGYAADIWSLGVTLFVLATGNLPFDDRTEMGMYQKIMGGRISFPAKPKLSLQFRSLLKSMLQKNPRQRASTAELILHPAIAS